MVVYTLGRAGHAKTIRIVPSRFDDDRRHRGALCVLA
jgi:hypothetical protein